MSQQDYRYSSRNQDRGFQQESGSFAHRSRGEQAPPYEHHHGHQRGSGRNQSHHPQNQYYGQPAPYGHSSNQHHNQRGNNGDYGNEHHYHSPRSGGNGPGPDHRDPDYYHRPGRDAYPEHGNRQRGYNNQSSNYRENTSRMQHQSSSHYRGPEQQDRYYGDSRGPGGRHPSGQPGSNWGGHHRESRSYHSRGDRSPDRHYQSAASQPQRSPASPPQSRHYAQGSSSSMRQHQNYPQQQHKSRSRSRSPRNTHDRDRY